jgi:hypothetical protein
MSDLMPAYVPETDQLILEGQQSGPAGEAGLAPVAGVDLAFDRADGHLVRVIVDCDNALGAELVTRLFGSQPSAIRRRAPELAAGQAWAVSPEAGLCAALSSLARLDAARAFSPVPASSPWWAAEAAVLAERAGLDTRAHAEARRAVRGLSCGPVAAPDEAALMAFAAADIAAASDDRDAARKLQASIVVGHPDQRSGSGLDVAAEMADLARDGIGPPVPPSLLSPALVPAGLFRPGLSPNSDLAVRRDYGSDRVTVRASLMPGADLAAVGRCQARLVDSGLRLVLAQAGFEQAGSVVRAELSLPSRPYEQGETWVEVTGAGGRPVRGSAGHSLQRALRWADAALRAERAPAGIAPRSSPSDWAALAAAAWERCRRDWMAAGDPGQAAAVPAARLAHEAALPGPAYLAEVLGA